MSVDFVSFGVLDVRGIQRDGDGSLSCNVRENGLGFFVIRDFSPRPCDCFQCFLSAHDARFRGAWWCYVCGSCVNVLEVCCASGFQRGRARSGVVNKKRVNERKKESADVSGFQRGRAR